MSPRLLSLAEMRAESPVPRRFGFRDDVIGLWWREPVLAVAVLPGGGAAQAHAAPAVGTYKKKEV